MRSTQIFSIGHEMRLSLSYHVWKPHFTRNQITDSARDFYERCIGMDILLLPIREVTPMTRAVD
jgi:hypothetical protein